MFGPEVVVKSVKQSNLSRKYVFKQTDIQYFICKFDFINGPQILIKPTYYSEQYCLEISSRALSTSFHQYSYEVNKSRKFRGLLNLSNDQYMLVFDLIINKSKENKDFYVVCLLFSSSQLKKISENLSAIEGQSIIYLKTIQSESDFSKLSPNSLNFWILDREI